MSDKNKNAEFFRNEDTLLRRAWIESALNGVRASLSSSFTALEFGEPSSSASVVTAEIPSAAVSRATVADKTRPALYVAWSGGVRRSGT